MRSRTFTQLRAGLLMTLVLLIIAALPATSVRGQVGGAEGLAGMVCANETSPGVYANIINLTATTGYISIPDGNTVYMWGYALGATQFQHPGPSLCFTQNSTVTINLTNTLPQPVSMIFPGQTGVAATGGVTVPNSLAQAAAATNGTVSYTFTVGQPGTFLYESGTNMQEQVQMGLFGSIVVRPTSQASPWFMYGAARTQFFPNDEYMMLLSEIDPEWHAAVEQGLPFSPMDYHPRYWLINGRAFPDTIAPNFASWLPTQPYGALLHIFPSNVGRAPAAMRFLNVGQLNHPIHPHGDHVRVIGRDGRFLQGPIGEDLSVDRFALPIGSGQAWDALYDWTNVGSGSAAAPNPYNPTTNLLPADVSSILAGTWLNPRSQNQMFKEPNFYSGSPYLGFQGDRDINSPIYNECGEIYQIWHSHALNEAANYEAGFGGMITLERIDPPTPNGCINQP